MPSVPASSHTQNRHYCVPLTSFFFRLRFNPPPRCQQSNLEVTYSLLDYETFLRVNRRLSEQTIKESCRKIRNFVKFTKGELNQKSISKYLACFLDAKATTYNSHITDLRRFVRDFLGQDHLIPPLRWLQLTFLEDESSYQQRDN